MTFSDPVANMDHTYLDNLETFDFDTTDFIFPASADTASTFVPFLVSGSRPISNWGEKSRVYSSLIMHVME
jgi:hypothetical protein